MVSKADRLATLVAGIQAIGDVPPLPAVNAWEAARIEAEVQRFIDRAEPVPAPLAQAWRTHLDESAMLGEESGRPLMACPLFQSLGVKRVNAMRAAVESGDGGAVLEAVSVCLAHGLVVPGWLASRPCAIVSASASGRSR